MSRKQITWTVDKDGRDKGKKFVITEMSAFKAEAWACRVILALLKSNPAIPKESANLGMAQLAAMAFSALGEIEYKTAEPLLSEMLQCARYMPDSHKAYVVREIYIADDSTDIEEVQTLVMLRKEIWSMHVDFSLAAVQSLLGGAAAKE